MKLSKKTFLNIVLILFVLSFFVTPMGHYGKIALNRFFSFSPPVIEETKRTQIADYDWKLKDMDWAFFNFERSRGKVIFINLWASWKLPSEAELMGIQGLYDRYKEKMDFYIITNENRPPVEAFMKKHKFTFPVTYLIIGEKMPVDTQKVPASYLIDKDGYIVVDKKGISDWNTSKVHELLDSLLIE
ncbi:MAG: TlpA disulfide reductase family protein [Bacteroidota bacterium]